MRFIFILLLNGYLVKDCNPFSNFYNRYVNNKTPYLKNKVNKLETIIDPIIYNDEDYTTEWDFYNQTYKN
jgi:hypothetical protein